VTSQRDLQPSKHERSSALIDEGIQIDESDQHSQNTEGSMSES
jgi:hypothetical protein